MVSKFSDVAVGLSADKLGFRDYAEGVIATLESLSKEDTPFTIGIFGSWGSGKTSFMQIMQELLESRGYETIFFNSWVYGNEEKPWIPFMITVVDALFKDGVVKKDLIRNIFLFSTDVVLQKYSQGMVSTGVISNLVERSRTRFAAKNWLDKDTKTVIERVTKIEEFKKEIEKKAEKLSKGEIIIFIDDLDRISEEKIVDFLDSLKIFLDIRGCIFVLGCDYEILKNALKHKHKEDEGLYKDYFDKIVQTEFYIPKISIPAIKNYLHFLTGWDEKEIEECTLLVIHSIGGNPRKIKRVVNATMLIKSVFEKRLATFLQAFERPKLRVMYLFSWDNVPGNDSKRLLIFLLEDLYIDWAENAEISKSYDGKIICIFKDENSAEMMIDEEKEKATLKIGDGKVIDLKVKKENGKLKIYREMIERGVEGKEGAPEEPVASKSEITKIFTPAEVFDLLFDKKVLFKLVCLREQWFTYYGHILIDAEKQQDLFSTTEEQEDKSKEDLAAIKFIKEDSPVFQGLVDLKTYLTLLEISSPEAGISIEYAEPAKLPINLFNRYMLFERINKGKVEETTIKEKVEQEDWKGNLSSYHFFSVVLIAFGYDNLLQDLFRKVPIPFITEQITDSDPKAIAWLLESVRGVEKETARTLLNQTKHTYAEKIRACTDLWAISGLLESVRDVEEETARVLLNQTKHTYADKIRDCSDLEAIGWLLTSMGWIEEEIARGLINETKDTYVRKIIDSADAGAIGRLLSSVSWIENETARGILKQTKEPIAAKIMACSDLGAIGGLLRSLSWIDKETARGILHETKDTYIKKIIDSADADAIGALLGSVWNIEDMTASDYDTARKLLDKTKDTYAEKIIASTDPEAIGVLLHNVSLIDKRTAGELLNRTKDTYAEKIIASTDPGAIGVLLHNVSLIDKRTAGELLDKTKDTYVEKIRGSANTFAIGVLLRSVRKIDEEIGRGLLNGTKDTYVEKIRDSANTFAIGWLLDSVRYIDEKTAEWLEKETNVESKDK